ncbi:hypothetical protein GUJ93_ZPchr0014g46923 [Zizania palustris]|uniref:DNA mismatch repair protein MutS-like N-terminal domain-containing protein n=1 Tax=Zizania palustris TaxID=103762 RepID=A0A8J5TAD1_ZIZPA|nr:hypothetical protein GUJ93_ZPchr0014g46923 [Zizania palustris]
MSSFFTQFVCKCNLACLTFLVNLDDCLHSRLFNRRSWSKSRKVSRGISMAYRKVNKQGDLCSEGMLSHILWWKEKMERCTKPSSMQLTQRLVYSNILGLDPTLRNGSMKDGNLNMEMLQFKSKFPREVLLCRVGDFYEAVGFDACILVEHAGLNPFGGSRSDSTPKAGCPVMVSCYITTFML